MELKEFMDKIVKNDLPHFVILFGEEQAVLDVYLAKLKSLVSHAITSFVSVADLYSKRGIKTLDSSQKLYIVNGDESYTREETKWADVANYFLNSKDILVLRYGKLKKSEKFYSRNKDYCVEFKPLTDNVLQQHILSCDLSLDDVNGLKLIHYCGNDYGRILLEIDKIHRYMSESNIQDANEAFKILDAGGVFYKQVGDITFELTDSVLYGDITKAFKKLDEAKRKGEHPILIASLLYTGFRNMLAVQGLGKNKKDASKRTGLQGYEVHNAIKNMGAYDLKTLERNMKICQTVESGIKTGSIPEDIALDYLVEQCLA